MGIKVASVSRYVVHTSSKSTEEWNAASFVRALKGDPLTGNGQNYVPVRGQRHLFNESNRAEVFDHFARLVWDVLDDPRIKEEWYDSEYDEPTFVPVPSSKAVAGLDCSSHVTQRLVASVGKCLGWETLDALRWTEELLSARRGGERDPDELERKAHVIAPVRNRFVILIDDVLTTGGHIRACARALRAKGAIVRLAVCAGVTVHENTDTPFAWDVNEYED